MTYYGSPRGGPIGHEQITALTPELVSRINESLESSGSSARVASLDFGLESSYAGIGGTYASGTLTTGQRFGDVYDSPFRFGENLTVAEAAAQFGEEIAFIQRDALDVALNRPRGSSPGAGERSVPSFEELGVDPTITGLATGTNFVPQDMLAMIHQGEAIVPKQYNPAIGGENVVASEIRALRDEVVQLRAEARSTAISSAKMFRLQDNWDVRGLTVKTDVDQPLETVAA